MQIRYITKSIKFFLLCVLVGTLAGCTTPRPTNIHNVCTIFKQYPEWFWNTQATQKKWGVPESVQMAIIYQESHFNATARPPREHLLWVIPWFRPTTAYGYSQALKSTWEIYEKSTGHYSADRSRFAAATDFIGWYSNRINKQLGIRKNDAYRLYLAYHEGIEGYREKTYLQKPWLMQVARNVSARANAYHNQLISCWNELPKKPWWRF